jgi:hypothetical protein
LTTDQQVNLFEHYGVLNSVVIWWKWGTHEMIQAYLISIPRRRLVFHKIKLSLKADRGIEPTCELPLLTLRLRISCTI